METIGVAYASSRQAPTTSIRQVAGDDCSGTSKEAGRQVGTYNELREAGCKDAHHIIQDAAVKTLKDIIREKHPLFN